MVTFHPVTLEDCDSEKQMKELFIACQQHREMNFIFTKSNADASGRIINQMIDKFVDENDNAIAFASLGMKKYLSALKFSSMVIGNSSSGLIEAPSFCIPTINIGDRQKGRLQAASVINCLPKSEAIEKAIGLALSDDFRDKARITVNPYGNGKTSEKIVSNIKYLLLDGKVNLKKKFYDCGVN